MIKIEVIGAACLDILISGYEIDAFFSGKHKTERITSSFGGDALNEAAVLKRLECDISLNTILGNDPAGYLIKDYLDRSDIKHYQNIFKNDIDTYISLVMIDNDGQRCFVGSKEGSVRLLDLDDIIIDDEAKIISFASLFISKKLDNEKLEHLFRKIKEKNKILCVDCSTPKNNEKISDLGCLKFVDYFFCNESEAKALCGCDDLMECEKKMYEADINDVVIKAGSKGCLYKHEYHSTEIITCVDSTGAGDSFTAGFIYALAQGRDISGCIKIANRFGSTACQYTGSISWLDKVAIKDLLI